MTKTFLEIVRERQKGDQMDKDRDFSEDDFAEEELEIVELPKREAMSLLNIHVHNLFHHLF